MDTLVYLLDILIVIIGVAFIIFVHELGHFAVAKWLGMKVEAFSIGFGKVLWSFQRGETEYRLSLIPLGGYVKLSGETPDQATGSKRDFYNRPASHRALVLVAGVVMNAVSAVFLLFAAYVIGIKEVYPEIGDVNPDSPAMLSNLQRGDVVKEINGIPVHDFTEVMQETALSAGEDIHLKVLRDDQILETTIKATYSELQGFYSIGVYPRPIAKVRVLHDSLAESGLKLWDEITHLKVDGQWQPITYYDELTDYVETTFGQELHVKARHKNGETFETTLKPTALNPRLGFVCAAPEVTFQDRLRMSLFKGQPIQTPLVIESILPGYPAKEMGMEVGDVIESATVAGQTTRLKTLQEMQQFLAKHQDDEILLHWQSKDGQKSGSFVPKKAWALGFVPMNNFQLTQLSLSEPMLLIGRSFRRARNDLTNVLRSISGFLTGDVAAKNMSGPIAIAKVSMMFVKLGIGSYLAFLAMISFNLAILNILPIPLLDGGHLLMVGIEKIIGRQVDEKIQIAFQYVGIVILGSLMLFVFYNDIFRF